MFCTVFVLGLRVGTEGSKWALRGVLLDPATDEVLPTTIDHFPKKSHSAAQQAHDAHDALAGALSAYEIHAVVLREADHHRSARIQDGTKKRLRLEGACLAACQALGVPVEVMDGQAIGRAIGASKDGAEDAARQLGVAANLVEAAAAALAAKSLI
ncbi:Uncharacterised protein [Mycobacteroides abscessus subsp. abscessus]|nr:Uncharacterised protein [Mycobacteroides abscessus subsp. abscessus]